jgi:hypothetical protein
VTVPSGSEQPAAFAVTVSGANPADGVTISAATGGWFGRGATVITSDVLVLAPASSVTHTLAVQVPSA